MSGSPFTKKFICLNCKKIIEVPYGMPKPAQCPYCGSPAYFIHRLDKPGWAWGSWVMQNVPIVSPQNVQMPIQQQNIQKKQQTTQNPQQIQSQSMYWWGSGWRFGGWGYWGRGRGRGRGRRWCWWWTY